MLILITNDDGVDAPGLRALADEMSKVGDVVVSAPSEQKSAISHSITLYSPLIERNWRERGIEFHAVDGTPADAVKLALRELLPEPPTIVVSGINHGLNTGSNILYSGTVAGALEAAQFDITSFAVSLEAVDKPDWRVAARLARPIIQQVARRYVKSSTVFNINVPARPASRVKGTLVTVQEAMPYEDAFERREDPRGRTYYWLKGQPEREYRPELARNGRAHVPTDAWAVSQGYVSVTPLRRDLTHQQMLDQTRKLFERRARNHKK